MKTKIFILIIGLTLSFFCSLATNISGSISTNPIWNTSGSPYNIVGNTTLEAGYTLTINADVIVNFVGEVGLIIKGTLKVNTEEGAMVFFKDDGDPNAIPPTINMYGGWIRFDNSSTANEIHNSTFKYLACDPGDSPSITNPIKHPYGAIHITNSTVTFSDCEILFNGNFHEIIGGTQTWNLYGMAGAVGIDGSTSNVTFENTIFKDNEFHLHEPGYGGAIYASNCDLNIIDCEFDDNLAGGNDSYGGAIYYETNNNGTGGSLNIDRCHFHDNGAGSSGGAIYLNRVGSKVDVSIKNSLICDNFGSAFDVNVSGGGIRAFTSENLTLIYNTITANNYGGHGNEPRLGDGIAFLNGTSYGMTFRNNIVYDNGVGIANDDNIYIQPSSNNDPIPIDYSDVGPCLTPSSSFDFDHCINVDPEFDSFNFLDWDLHLTEGSPCINMGFPNPTEEEYDLDNKLRPKLGGFDMGAYEYGDEFLITIISDKVDFCADDDLTVNLSFEGMPDFLITTYTWDLGDGTIINNQPTVNHTYLNQLEPYTVKLTVTLTTGDVLDPETIITIFPIPQVYANPTSIREGQSVNLSGSPEVPIESWQLYYYDVDGQFVEISSGGSVSSFNVNHVIDDADDGKIEIYLDYNYGNITCTGETIVLVCSDDCILPFAPLPKQKYILSAWVSEDMLPTPQTTFSSPAIQISYLLNDGTTYEEDNFVAEGQIIDGWQKIEKIFTVNENAIDITISLLNTNTADINTFFDDIRIFPVNGNMKSFVYDPVNLRFVAELDENNFATYYEYDQEGKLIRVKKETERGIVTLQESRGHMSKLSFE